MKRKLALLLSVLTALSFFILPTKANLTGDVNGDGVVTSADARLALRACVGLESFSGGANDAIDVDCDNRNTSADARIILRASVRLQSFEGNFTADFIDVGQADAILISCDGETMLIDGGNTDDADDVASFLVSNGISSLDYVVCTHAHEDHVGGLAGIINTFTVSDSVFAPRTTSQSVCYTAFKNACAAKRYNVVTPPTGYTFTLGSGSITVLGPVTENVSDVNNTSIVLKITYGKTSFLLTGDAEKEAEDAMLAAGCDLSATVLKVGHHGSSSSSSYVFLREILPEAAIISVGTGNTYGHPNENTVSRLSDCGAFIFRTDTQGNVRVISNGKTVSVETSKNRSSVTLPTQTGDEAQQTCYIGNLNTGKFHVPTCSSLPAEKNRIYFSSYTAAVSGGYTPCSKCIK